jgi:ComF family protein
MYISMYKKIYTKILDTLFPEYCLGCRSFGTSICMSCLSSGDRILSQDSLPEYINPIYSYKDPLIKKLIWQLKYKNKKQIAKDIAPIVYDALLPLITDLQTLSGVQVIYVVPIPLHISRKRHRGYNQSELLAKELIEIDKTGSLVLSIDALLRTKKSTPNAKTHSKRERIQNTRGSFEVNSKLLAHSHIVLIDDVVTTGTTLGEARKVLLQTSAHSVHAVTIAH